MISRLVPAACLLALGPTLFSSHEALAISPRERMELHVEFPRAEITGTDATGFEISMKGLPTTLDAWLPALPFETLRIALPPGAHHVEVSLEEAHGKSHPGTLARRAPMLPIGSIAPPLSEMPSPTSRGSLEVSLQTMHGVPVAVVRFVPVEVNQDGFFVMDKAKLALSFDSSPEVAPRPLAPWQARQLERLVSNPGALPLGLLADESSDDYEMLVITNDALAGYSGPESLYDLQSHWEGRGLRSRVVTVATIERTQPGADLAEKIRNHIAQEYGQRHIQYVLLAGDGDASGAGAIIPARRLWSKVMAYDGTWRELETRTPADIYYSCLDGTFNGNGNSKWGEPDDGPEGGDVDLLPEVTVGRAPIETPEELRNFVRKTMSFANAPRPRKALLLGEVLFEEKNLFGDDYMKQLVGPATDHGYETQGYGPDWTVDLMGDRLRAWTGSEALATINRGDYSMVNHLGHSNTWYNMRLSSGSTFPAFQNPSPFFYYTQGCYPGDFTANDSFIEKFIRHRYGVAAAVANTVYGLGPEDPDPRQSQTPGASQMLHRQFVDALFNEGIRSLGVAHQDSKLDFLGYRSTQEMRWVFWSATYFGDPSLPLNLSGE